MARSTGPFIVAFGEEDFLLDRLIQGRKAAWKNRQVTTLDGSVVTEEKFLSVCETVSFFDEGGRAVILDNAQEMDTSKELAAFIERKDPKDTSVLILVIVRDKKASAVWNAAIKKGTSVEYPRLRSWETEKVVSRYIDEAAILGLKLEKGVPELLQTYLGDNLRTASNELRKLSYLIKPGETITKAHVHTVISPDRPAEAYEVGDLAVSKDAKRAMYKASLVFTYMGDGAAVPITYGLVKAVERTLVARQMLDRGDTSTVLGIRFNLHKFVVEKNIIPVAQKHTVPSLLRHMQHLCRLDAQVKGSATSKRTLVELAVLSIAA
jgi:DNA polymerase III delta subunit